MSTQSRVGDGMKFQESVVRQYKNPTSGEAGYCKFRRFHTCCSPGHQTRGFSFRFAAPVQRRMWRIHSPQRVPSSVINIATSAATPIWTKKAMALASVGKKRLRAHGDWGRMKYGKLFVAKTQLRDAGDIRKSAKGHCTATKLARNAAPSAADCAHRFHPPIRWRSRSITIAGTISSMGKSGGIRCVIF